MLNASLAWVYGPGGPALSAFASSTAAGRACTSTTSTTSRSRRRKDRHARRRQGRPCGRLGSCFRSRHLFSAGNREKRLASAAEQQGNRSSCIMHRQLCEAIHRQLYLPMIVGLAVYHFATGRRPRSGLSCRFQEEFPWVDWLLTGTSRTFRSS
jgi:hypothetical protein